MCYLQTNENIAKSSAWSCLVSGFVNEAVLKSFGGTVSNSTTSFSIFLDPTTILKGNSFLELKLEMTLSGPKRRLENRIPLQTFFDVSLQYKDIIANNKYLLNESKYSDFTFNVKGKEFKVHKNILAAASPVFDKLFSAKLSETRTNECIIKDIEPAIFQYLLSFIYSGELPGNLYEENISQKLFNAAHYYEIEKLVDVCKQVQNFKLSIDTAAETYEWAFTYELADIMMNAWNIIRW